MNIKTLTWRNGGACYVHAGAVLAIHDETLQPNGEHFLSRVMLTSGQAIVVRGTPQEVRDTLFGRPASGPQQQE